MSCSARRIFDSLTLSGGSGSIGGTTEGTVRDRWLLWKVKDWLEAGCRRVWVADPRTETVTVYRSLSEITILSGSDTLAEPELLPGFQTSVAGFFRR